MKRLPCTANRGGGRLTALQCRQPGFTLIELLVVVAIIALLISILVPALSGVREQGKMTKCLAHMRSCGQSASNIIAERGRFQLVADEVGINLADPDRQRYMYGQDGELLSWPVAIAKGTGIDYTQNWSWGVRADSYAIASGKASKMKTDMGMLVCPSDRTRFGTPYFPRSDGLRGSGDPGDPTGTGTSVSYWGLLSFAINEDLAGAEGVDSGTDHSPACWRSVPNGSSCTDCWGQRAYPGFTPCGDKEYGRRLQGNFDKIYRPGDVGFIFDAGRDDNRPPADLTGEANLVLSGARPGGSASASGGPFLGDFEMAFPNRVPTTRHPRNTINVLFADMHGAAVRGSKPKDASTTQGNVRVMTEFSPQVRVSPYPPATCH